MGISDPEVADWARARTTPLPMATYTQPVPHGSARSAALPRACISCTEGPLTSVFGHFADKVRAAGWVVQEIARGHDAMLTAPDAVAKLFLELAGTAQQISGVDQGCCGNNKG
jgi:hypothetical protein